VLHLLLPLLFTEYGRGNGLTTFRFISTLLWTSWSNLIEFDFELSVIERLTCFADKNGKLGQADIAQSNVTLIPILKTLGNANILFVSVSTQRSLYDFIEDRDITEGNSFEFSINLRLLIWWMSRLNICSCLSTM